ncbi:MAG: hypothetical protein Q4F11_03620 [Eubacteriales bacterium]|nr:hypothetical protein [Eubacteriales bacterium]
MEEMEKIEKVQKLCEKTGASAVMARAALEECQWDMFEAFLKLDGQKTTYNNGSNYTSVSGGMGFTEYNTAGSTDYNQGQTQYKNPQSASFGETVGKCVKWFGKLIQRGMDDFLDIERDGSSEIHVPITILVILFIPFNVFIIALLIIGLFCGYRYSFSGPDFDGKSDYTEGADYGDKNSNR